MYTCVNTTPFLFSGEKGSGEQRVEMDKIYVNFDAIGYFFRFEPKSGCL